MIPVMLLMVLIALAQIFVALMCFVLVFCLCESFYRTLALVMPDER